MRPKLMFYVEYFQSYNPVGMQSQLFGFSLPSLPLADALGLYVNTTKPTNSFPVRGSTSPDLQHQIIHNIGMAW